MPSNKRPGETAAAVFSPSTATALAIIQRVLVTVVFAFATRRLSLSRQAAIAPLIVVGVGALVILVTSALGIGV